MMMNRLIRYSILLVFGSAVMACAASPPPQVVVAPPPVIIQAPPELVIVPGTPVYYAPGVNFNFFFYSGRYYLFHNGTWFYSMAYGGPWTYIALEHMPQPVLAVPVQYHRAPPGHWRSGECPPGLAKQGRC